MRDLSKYNNKYLKYKNKYLLSKMYKGGDPINYIKDLIINSKIWNLDYDPKQIFQNTDFETDFEKITNYIREYNLKNPGKKSHLNIFKPIDHKYKITIPTPIFNIEQKELSNNDEHELNKQIFLFFFSH